MQVTFRHMDPSPVAEARIREEAARLDRYFDRITSCRVVVEAPHPHHLRDRGFHLSTDIDVPRSEVVMKHEPPLHATLAQSGAGDWEKHPKAHSYHRDIDFSIRDAFTRDRAAAWRNVGRQYLRLISDVSRGHAVAQASPQRRSIFRVACSRAEGQ